jgi:transposase
MHEKQESERPASSSLHRTKGHLTLVGKGNSCYNHEISGNRNTKKYMQNILPHQLADIVRSAHEAGLSAEALERLTWVTYFVEHHGAMQETCDHFGIARSTLHRWLERFDPNNVASLEEGGHAPHAVRQPVVPPHVTALIRSYRERWPLIGKEKISRVLLEEHGVVISASSVGRVIERECLYFANTPLHWRKRMEGRNDLNALSGEKVAASALTPRMTQAAAPIRTMRGAWSRAAVLLSVAAHVVALSFACAVLWEAAQAHQRVSASATGGQLLQSIESASSLSAGE